MERRVSVRVRALLAVLVILVLAGLGVRWMLTERRAGGEAILPAQRVAPARVERIGASESAEPTLRSLGPAGERAPIEQAPLERAAVDPASSPVATSATSTPRALIRLHGRCVDGAGVPLAGVDVSLAALHATTAADGRFELAGEIPWDPGRPPRLGVHVLARFEGHADAHRAVFPPPFEEDLGVLVLRRAGRIEGRVTDPHGRPIEGARVTAHPPPAAISLGDALVASLEPGPHGTTDADGRYSIERVAEGERLVVPSAVHHESHDGLRAVVHSGEALELDFVLALFDPAQFIELLVLDPHGAPVPFARIAYELRAFLTRGSGTGTTDAEGIFRHAARGRGTFDVTATDPRGRWRSATLRGVRPGSGVNELRFGEPLVLELAVRARDGGAVEPFRVSVRQRSSAGPHLAAGGRDQHPGGRARIDVPGDDFRVVVDAPGYALFESEQLSAARPPELLDVALEPLPGARGVVLGADGKPLEGARVSLHRRFSRQFVTDGFPVRSDRSATASTRSDQHGRFELTVRERGAWYVRAEHEDLAPAELGPIEIDPARGVTGLELVLGPGGAIEGRVLLPPRELALGAIVGASRGDGFARTVRADEEGRYRFERLTPGPWLVKRVDAEITPLATSTTSDGSPLTAGSPSSCVVVAGEVTRFDVDPGP